MTSRSRSKVAHRYPACAERWMGSVAFTSTAKCKRLAVGQDLVIHRCRHRWIHQPSSGWSERVGLHTISGDRILHCARCRVHSDMFGAKYFRANALSSCVTLSPAAGVTVGLVQHHFSRPRTACAPRWRSWSSTITRWHTPPTATSRRSPWPSTDRERSRLAGTVAVRIPQWCRIFRRPDPAHLDNDIQVGPSQPPEISGSRSMSKYLCFTLGSLAC